MGLLGETAKLAVELNLGGNFNSKMKLAEGSLDKFNDKADRARLLGQHIGTGINTLATNLLKLTAVGAGIVGVGVKKGLSSLSELQSGIDANKAAIEQTTSDWRIGAHDIAKFAEDIETAVGSAFDDKDINAAATTLIRFGGVTEQNLKPALVVMTDLATKTGDVDSAAKLLAKALADPEKAAAKLAKQGIILTAAQQKQIAAFIKVGDTANAQKVILDALSRVTAGAALASQDKFARSQAILADVVENAERALATGFVPVIEKVRDLLSEELAKPSTLANIEKFGKSLAGGLENLIDTARGLPWSEIGSALGKAGEGAKAIFDAFMGLPPDTKNILIGLTALNKLSGGAVIKIGVDILQGVGGGLIQQFIGKGSIANPMYVVNLGGGAGGPGVPGAPAVPSVLGSLATAGALVVPPLLLALDAKNKLDFVNDPNNSQADKLGFSQFGVTDLPPGSDIPGASKLMDSILRPAKVSPLFKAPGSSETVGIRNAVRDGVIAGKITGPEDRGVQRIVDTIGVKADKANRAAEGVRDRVEANRIAVQTGTQAFTGRIDMLERAVRASKSDLSVTVNVRTNITTSSVTRAIQSHSVYSTGMHGAELGA